MKARFAGTPAALAAAASALVATALSVGVARAQANAPEPAPAFPTPDGGFETEEPPLPEFDLEKAIISETGLTADQAAARAVARAPQVASAQATANSAHWDARAMWSNFLPQVQGYVQYRRIKFVENRLDFGFDPATIEDPVVAAVFEEFGRQLRGGGENFTQPTNNYAVGANAQIPVSEMLLRFWPAYESSKHVAQARKFQAEAASWEVEQRAKEAFYQYALALANRAVFQQALKQAEAQRDQVQLFVEAGTVAPVDLMSASARYENARSAVARAEGHVAVARNTLATLMGVRTEDVGPIREDVTQLPPEVQLTEQQLVERGLERRPELKALRALVGASDLQRKAERGAAFPQLSVEGNVLHAQPNPRYIPINRNYFRNSWEIGAMLSWTPNQSLVGYQRSQRASAEMARARADVIALEDAVRIEVVQALEDFRAAEAAAQASRAQLEAAEEAYRVRLATYRVGATTFVDLLQDDLRVTEARLALVNDAVNARVALVRLRRAAVLD